MANATDNLNRKCHITRRIKITDINQFCLELIFTHLDLVDLLNVADSNKYLKFATHIPFVRNYAGKAFEFRLDNFTNVKVVRM